ELAAQRANGHEAPGQEPSGEPPQPIEHAARVADSLAVPLPPDRRLQLGEPLGPGLLRPLFAGTVQRERLLALRPVLLVDDVVRVVVGVAVSRPVAYLAGAGVVGVPEVG